MNGKEEEIPEGCINKLDKLNKDLLGNAPQDIITQDLSEYQKCLQGEKKQE